MTDYSYVYTVGANTVFAIDPVSYTVAATIPLPTFGTVNDTFAMTPDRKNLFAVMLNNNTIYQIDTATNTIIHTIPMPGGSTLNGGSPGCATDTFAYFALRDTSPNAIAIVTVATGAVTIFPVPTGMTGPAFSGFQFTVITPDLTQVWIGGVNGPGAGATTLRGSVVIDTLSTSPSVTFIQIGGGSSSFFAGQLLPTADNNWVYALEGNVGDRIYKYSTATKTLNATITGLPGGAYAIGAIDATATNVYATFPNIPVIEVINIATNAVTSFVPPAMNYFFEANPNPNTTFAYEIKAGASPAVLIIPNAAPGTGSTISLPDFGGHSAVTGDGKFLWIPSGGTAGVFVIDTSTNTLVHTVGLSGSDALWVSPTSGATAVSFHAGDLFIPRKGRSGIGGGYVPEDLTTNWLRIENWANHQLEATGTSGPVQLPNLFLPEKPIGRFPSEGEIDRNWRALEDWSIELANVLKAL